ncbi:Rieske (2Fe-2S) protein [Fluviicola sp.]|uniref:QcrA and Rieske domain-containing protein n=1 Tax=Fluviicola sp. TaxID=1917219 RepID=UPI0031D24B71
MDLDRRAFIRKSCLACASIAGIGVLSTLVQSCSPLVSLKVTPEQGFLNVPLSHFTETNKLVLLKNYEALDFDIAVVQLAGNQYKAFQMQCTHVANNPLVATKNGFFCNTHGSAFGFDGQVTNSPAKRPLKEYQLEITSEIIKVKL